MPERKKALSFKDALNDEGDEITYEGKLFGKPIYSYNKIPKGEMWFLNERNFKMGLDGKIINIKI